MNTLGWIGSLLLAFCAIPESVKAYKTKRCEMTWTFLLMWFFGEIFVLIPVIFEIQNAFLLFNYGLNTVLISYLVYTKYKQETK